MGGAALAALLRALAALTRSRVVRTLSVVADAGPEPSSAVVDALYEILQEMRLLAYEASLLHLQYEALEASRGSGEPAVAPAPSPPAYSRDAVRNMVRRSPGGAAAPEAVARAAERHVYAASRQTVAAAVTETGYTELLEDAREFVGGLDDFPPEVRRAIEADVERFARELQEASREEQDRALQEVQERVSRARDHLLASRVMTREQERTATQVTAEVTEASSATAMPPAEALADPGHEWWRTDRSGRRIVRPFAFARVVQPSANGPCGFCAVLASRGPVYRSSYSAGLRADAFHNSCRCLVVPVYTSRRWIGRDQQAHYARVYVEASRSGDTGRDLINRIDRELRSGPSTEETE